MKALFFVNEKNMKENECSNFEELSSADNEASIKIRPSKK